MEVCDHTFHTKITGKPSDIQGRDKETTHEDAWKLQF